MTACMKLFADDGKIFSKVKIQENQAVVQENVTIAKDWAEIWDIVGCPN